MRFYSSRVVVIVSVLIRPQMHLGYHELRNMLQKFREERDKAREWERRCGEERRRAEKERERRSGESEGVKELEKRLTEKEKVRACSHQSYYSIGKGGFGSGGVGAQRDKECKLM